MKRLFGWMAGLAGIAALGRLLAARSRGGHVATPVAPPQPAAPDVAGEDPAEALRRTLAARRETGDEAVEEAASEAPAETLEERRARIHAKAQEAIDAMRSEP